MPPSASSSRGRARTGPTRSSSSIFLISTFRLARRIKALGIPVVYYISPQIWAWRAKRLEAIRRFADLVLVIFPFEEAIYREGGVPVEFVGHPLVDLARPSAPRAAFLNAHRMSQSSPTIGILPGSRPNEVTRILPDLMVAAKKIRLHFPSAQFLVARAPNLDDYHFESLSAGGQTLIRVLEGETDAILAASNVVLTASGTATVQTALHDTPMVIVYRVSPITLSAAAASRHRRQGGHGQPDCGRANRAGADSGCLHAGRGRGRGDSDPERCESGDEAFAPAWSACGRSSAARARAAARRKRSLEWPQTATTMTGSLTRSGSANTLRRCSISAASCQLRSSS